MNVKTGRDPALGTAPVGKLFWKLALPGDRGAARECPI